MVKGWEEGVREWFLADVLRVGCKIAYLFCFYFPTYDIIRVLTIVTISISTIHDVCYCNGFEIYPTESLNC